MPTKHQKQFLSAQMRSLILELLSECGDPELTPTKLKRLLIQSCHEQEMVPPGTKVVNDFLRSIGIRQRNTLLWILPLRGDQK
jgi:hypothetical protein